MLQRGAKMGHPVSAAVMERAYGYVERSLAGDKPTNESWWPAYTAWQAFAVKVLAEGGRNADSHFNRLYGYVDRMPVFALSYLLDASVARGERSPREGELLRRKTKTASSLGCTSAFGWLWASTTELARAATAGANTSRGSTDTWATAPIATTSRAIRCSGFSLML